MINTGLSHTYEHVVVWGIHVTQFLACAHINYMTCMYVLCACHLLGCIAWRFKQFFKQFFSGAPAAQRAAKQSPISIEKSTTHTVPLKGKLPPLVSFLARRVSFLSKYWKGSFCPSLSHGFLKVIASSKTTTLSTQAVKPKTSWIGVE